MTPTDVIGDATLYRGDAYMTLCEMDDGVADTVITDPPYCSGAISEAQRVRSTGQGLRSENLRRFGWFSGDNMGTAGLVGLLRAVAFECRRVVKPTGSMIVFADWRMLSVLQPAIESAGLRYQNLLVWDKGSMGLGSGFRCQHELMMHFTFGSPEYHAKDVPNVLSASRIRANERDHQAQKPVDLLRELVRVTCPEGGTVLDPFMGSASTLIAARLEACKGIGIESGVEEYQVAVRRVSDTPVIRNRVSRSVTVMPNIFEGME